MTTNGIERELAGLEQGELVELLDFPIEPDEARRRSEGLRAAFAKMAGTETLNGCSIPPLVDASGNSHELSPEEWADVLAMRAQVMRVPSYAGELPPLPEPGLSEEAWTCP